LPTFIELLRSPVSKTILTVKSFDCSFVIIVCSLIFSSCDDDENYAGRFSLNEKSYQLTNGFAELNGIYGAGGKNYYYWIITLTSKGINIDNNKDFEGTGDAVVLEIAAINDDRFVPEGTYNFSDETAYSYGVYLDYNTKTGTGTSYISITDALITIEDSGDGVKINFSITLINGSTVTGSYKGVLVRTK
jgi:hypothetical protein